MNRRGFLAGILALGIAPALVRAHSLMPVRVLDEPRILTPDNPLFTGELGRYEGARFIGPEYFDYGNQAAMLIQLPDGRLHAVRCYGRARHPAAIPNMKRELLRWAANQSPCVPRGILLT